MNVGQDTARTHTPAKHRLRMVEMAVRKNFWIRAGGFECKQRSPIRQLAVLKHYQEKLSHKHDETIRVMYVCGSEVLEDLVAPHPENPTALRRGESVKYCLDDDVIEYINEHNLYKTTLINGDEQEMPSEAPQSTCTEIVSSALIGNRILSSKWHTKASADSSCESCSSSLEASEPQFLSRNIPPSRFPTSSDRHAVICSDKKAEHIPSPSKEETNKLECDAIVPTSTAEHSTSQMTVTSCAKEKISATITLSSKNTKRSGEFLKENCVDQIPEKLSSSMFTRPILSQAKPATNSPLFDNKSSDCDKVPNCMVSSVTLDVEKKLRGLADSPSYDNVTLDDLLIATTSWADYLQGESERIEGLNNRKVTETQANNESYKEPAVPSDPPSCNTSCTGEKDKKRSWFFNSKKSLKEPKPPEEDQHPMQMCATDRRQQKQTLSEILWRMNSQSKGKERWSEILPPSCSPPHCLRHSEQYTAMLRNEPNSSTSRLTNLPEDEQQTETPDPTLPNNVGTARSHSEATTTVDDGVTLRYRCYNLTSTPETTV
ncbi:unnamed protein product [Angiostrongylus costaricensis]|uniref:CTP_transf_like domain-containing protein n=1 Tax=Angiostrongylus costaricensis TaxID=334426 RepID=A0A0R3PZ40_ANGCS|nr:unnamed protein product [Angiostrongylus costaricensis]